MALEFPTAPTNGQQYTDGNGITWEYASATTSWAPVTVLDQGLVTATNVLYSAVSLTGTNVNATLGRYFYKTITTNTTFTFSAPAAGYCAEFYLELTNGGLYTITWPATVDWEDGYAPVLSSSGLDIVGFVTRAQCSPWHGFVATYNSK
jgi:hypothetical protein